MDSTTTPGAAATARCPFHAQADEPLPATTHPPGTWPPGPRSHLTGWSHLRRMSRDMLGTLADWKATYGDVVHARMWPEHQVTLTDPALVRELLLRHHDALIRWERGMDVFSQLHGHSVLVAEGEPWCAKRDALQPAFAPKAVHPFVPAIAQAAADAFAGWRTGADWPIESALTSLGMDIILRMTFSSAIAGDARRAEQAVHDTAAAANAELYWPASWPDRMPWKRAKRRGLAVLDALVDGHVQARRALPPSQWPNDLLSRLLALHRDDPAAWPLRAVRDECMTTFLAGHETTAATLTWWSWCLATNPQAQAAARTEVDAVLGGRAPTVDDLPALAFVGQTLHETLRLYPAAPILLTRRATREIALGGWRFPARTLFTVPVRLMHLDARWFPEPLAWRPERFGPGAPGIPRGAFMPFGAGPRVCLGQHLAFAEMTVIAAMLLQRFELVAPMGMAAPGTSLAITLRPKVALRLGLVARGG